MLCKLYGWNCTVCNLQRLASFHSAQSPIVQASCCMPQQCVPFHGWVLFYALNVTSFVTSAEVEPNATANFVSRGQPSAISRSLTYGIIYVQCCFTCCKGQVRRLYTFFCNLLHSQKHSVFELSPFRALVCSFLKLGI